MYPFTKISNTLYKFEIRNFLRLRRFIFQRSQFTTSSSLRADVGLLARIEELRLKLENNVKLFQNKKAAENPEATLEKNVNELDNVKKRLDEWESTKETEKSALDLYLTHFSNFLKPAEKLEKEKLNEQKDKVELLFNEKITDEVEKSNPSILKLIQLQKTKENSINNTEDKVEFLVHKSIEKSISGGELTPTSASQYYLARVMRLRERKTYREEENKVFSESLSTLSPINAVLDIQESSPMDPTDED